MINSPRSLNVGNFYLQQSFSKLPSLHDLMDNQTADSQDKN